MASVIPMALDTFDVDDYPPEGKSAEELEGFLADISKFLSGVEEEEKMEACKKVGEVLLAWQTEIGEGNVASLRLGVELLKHLNSIHEEHSTDAAFALAEALLPHLKMVLGEAHELTLRGMLLFGELLAKYREPEESHRMLSSGLQLMDAAATAADKTSIELYDTLPGAFHEMLGKVEVERSKAESALAHFKKATELVRMAPPSNEKKRLLPDVLVSYAHFAVENGAETDSDVLKILIEARTSAEEFIDEDPECFFLVMAEVADHHRRSGNPMEALAELERALALAEERFPPSHRQVIIAKANAAAIMSQHDHIEKAQALLEEVLPLAEGTRLECSVLENLAGIYAEVGRQKEAEQLLNRGVLIARSLFGDCSDELVEALRSKAALLASVKRLDEAMGVLNHALALNEDLETGIPYNVFELRELASKITLELGDFTAARGHAQAMLNLRLESVGRAHPHTAEVLFLQGRIEVREDPSVALELVREALGIHEEFYEGKPHQATAEMFEAAAELLFDDEGEPEEAIKMQRKAVEMYQQLFGESGADSITSALALASYLQQAGEADAGREIVRKLVHQLEGTGYHLYLAMAYATLADVNPEDEAACLDANEKALAELQQMERPHEMKISVNQALAGIYYDRMEMGRAIAYQEAALAAARDIAGAQSSEAAEQLQSLAQLMLDLQQHERALVLMDEAHTISLATHADEDEIAEGLLMMAAALQGVGKIEEATARYEEALEMTAELDAPEIEARALGEFGAFILDSAADRERGAELMERALPKYIDIADFQAVGSIPTQLYREFPDQAMRWMPLFEEAMEFLEEFREEFEESDPAAAAEFNRALGDIRAELLGRITKAAI